MALMESTWQETDVLKLFFVKDFNDAAQNFMIKFFEIHLVIQIISLHWTLAKKVTGLIIVFWSLLLLKPE
jgi:hypothetical protein